MSFDQAVEFFQKEGYQSKETAVVETKRGTADPTYLYYTLGKLEIMKLREDLKKKQGAAFSLEEVSRRLPAPGLPAHQDRARGAAGRRFADALKGVCLGGMLRAGYMRQSRIDRGLTRSARPPQASHCVRREMRMNKQYAKRSFPRRPGHALFAGHQSHSQGNAGAGRQAHHPVRRRRSDCLGHRAHHHHHRPRQGRDGRPLRPSASNWTRRSNAAARTNCWRFRAGCLHWRASAMCARRSRWAWATPCCAPRNWWATSRSPSSCPTM